MREGEKKNRYKFKKLNKKLYEKKMFANSSNKKIIWHEGKMRDEGWCRGGKRTENVKQTNSKGKKCGIHS